MTALRPMPPEAYASYLASAVAGYAEDNVAVGRWPRAGALERSRADFESLLPQGLATPDNHLFEIHAAPAAPGASGMSACVGVLWFAVETRHGLRSAFVYDLEVHPGHRRQGHALRAFQALEALVSEIGLCSIGLHVFGHNPGAQSLYEKLGYRVTGLNMVKRWGADV